MAITKEFVQSVRKSLEKQPDLDFGGLARSLNATEAEVITALPVSMRLKARSTAFDAIWSMLTQWESFGPVHLGRDKQRLPLQSGLALKLLRQGTLKVSSSGEEIPLIRENIGYIWFISKDTSSAENNSICFLDKQGHHILSISLAGWDSVGHSQLEEFEDMKKRFGVVPTPKNRCKGCKSCSCHAAAGAHA